MTRPTSPDLKKSRLLRVGVRCRGIEAEMPIRLRRGHASAWRALQESVLDQEGLVNFFERSRILADSGGDGADTNRPSFEFLDDGLEDAGVHVVEAELIDFK